MNYEKMHLRLVKLAQEQWEAYRASPLFTPQPDNAQLWSLIRWCRSKIHADKEGITLQIPTSVHLELAKLATDEEYDSLEDRMIDEWRVAAA